jgi:hypothetical protein
MGFKEWISDRSREKPDVDVNRFNDIVADSTQWNAVIEHAQSASFCTHRLKQIDSGKVIFTSTAGFKAFTGIFLLAALIIPMGMLRGYIGGATFFFKETRELVLSMLLTFGFGFGAIYMVYALRRPVVFDKGSGYFRKGYKRVETSGCAGGSKTCVSLDKIHAIQLLALLSSGSKVTYYCYQMNLVLHNGDRMNVIAHGNFRKIKADAEALGQFLNVPVWDGVSED